KIEELTLYSIEQNKKINQLQLENKILKSQSEKINQLEKQVQQLLTSQK
ncbi:MAG TPA: cell wall anchor protein, partial [Chryseobacterium indologenes]|nr:cell wall anchor protein [Chryseobacterium indologenes]